MPLTHQAEKGGLKNAARIDQMRVMRHARAYENWNNRQALPLHKVTRLE